MHMYCFLCLYRNYLWRSNYQRGVVGDPFNWFNPVMKFVSDLQQVGGLVCPGTPLSSTNKTDNHDITEIMLKVVSGFLRVLLFPPPIKPTATI